MRKQCRRKIWSTDINPVAHAIAGASITTDDVLSKLRMGEYSALDSIIKGEGTVLHWQVIVDTLNVAECMALDGIGPEVLPYCKQAEESLVKAARYYEKTKKIILDAQGIKAIRELIEYADLQQKSISRAKFETYIEKTRNKVRSKAKEVYEIS